MELAAPPDEPKTVLDSLRWILFLGVGLALPLFAFPVLKLSGRPIDLATFLAAAFVLASLHRLLSTRTTQGFRLLAVGAVAVPLLVLAPPRLARFSVDQFAMSYFHWLLVIFFFVSASSLTLSERSRRRLLVTNVVAGTTVALFALYQVFGIPRGWPGTGTMLLPFQREPFRIRDMGTGYVRPTSLFLEPAWMGGHLAWVLALAVALVAEVRRRRKLADLASIALMLLAIGASVSWGAYADTAAGLIVTAIVLVRFRGLSARSIAVAAGILSLLVLLAGVFPAGRRAISAATSRFGWLLETPVAAERMTPEVMDSSWVRFGNLAHTAALFRGRVTRGVGLGQFPNYARGPGGDALSFRDPWCGWLAIGAEMGLLGPLLLLGAMLLILVRWWLSPSREPFECAGPALIAVCAVMQVHTGSYIDLWFWYPLSLGLVLSAPTSDKPPHV